MFDVSTPVASLEATGSGQTAIFADLGSGTSLAAQTVSAANNGQIVSIPVNSDGINALNAGRGSQFAFGGAITTIVGTSDQNIFGSSSTGTRQLVLTSLEPGDWYSITVPNIGYVLNLATSTPASGPGEFANSLIPQIDLYDPSGVLVASGTVGPDGRNQSINYAALTPGVYHVRVLGAAGTHGEYFLSTGNPLAVTIPSDVTEGGSSPTTGTISIPAALASDLIVSIVSSDPDRIAVPATVTIPAGQTSAPLPLTVIDDALLNGPESISIMASAVACTSGISTITIHDNESAVLTVSLPSSAHETDGTLSGTITSDQAPTRNITVQLISGDTSRLTVPATVTLPAGQTTVNFNATLLDDHVIEAGPTPVAVTAQTENWTSGSATVSLLDDDRTMTLALPASGWEGQTLTGTGTVQIGGTLTSDLVVSLLSADTAELTVPATVTIPHGQRTATFDVTLHSNGLRQGPQTRPGHGHGDRSAHGQRQHDGQGCRRGPLRLRYDYWPRRRQAWHSR